MTAVLPRLDPVYYWHERLTALENRVLDIRTLLAFGAGKISQDLDAAGQARKDEIDRRLADTGWPKRGRSVSRPWVPPDWEPPMLGTLRWWRDLPDDGFYDRIVLGALTWAEEQRERGRAQ